jgi:3-phosphoshikimate 1-carboxyvinyltransferase
MAADSTALPIAPRGPLDATLTVPGSKSITNRALLTAALAQGESRLEGALESDDTHYMRSALAALGVEVHSTDSGGDESSSRLTVRGTGGRLRAPDGPLFVGNAGTAMRFLTAAGTLADGKVVIDGDARMRERPLDDLTRALEALGANLSLRGSGGCPPVELDGGGLAGGRARIEARRSSQYVSAVLLAAPYAKSDVFLE